MANFSKDVRAAIKNPEMIIFLILGKTENGFTDCIFLQMK